MESAAMASWLRLAQKVPRMTAVNARATAGGQAMLRMIRRDGANEIPAAVAFPKDLMTIVAAAVIFAIVVYFHEVVIGVSPLPGL